MRPGPGQLARLCGLSLRRNRGALALASVGIVIGTAALCFFTALGLGVRRTVLERVFAIERVELEPKSYDVGAFRSGGLFGSKTIDDALIARLSELPGVEAAYPKMRLTFPSGVSGGRELLGREVRGELVADGIPAALIAPEIASFRDYESIACQDDRACPASYRCDDGLCRGRSCSPEEPCAGGAVCEQPEGRCAAPIPVAINPALLEVYNGSLHTALSGAAGTASALPKLGRDALIGLRGEAYLGRSFLFGRAAAGEGARRTLEVAGFSERAIPLGVTLPLGYVRRFNERFGPEGSAESYHAVVLEVSSSDAIPAVVAYAERRGLSLTSRYEDARRAGALILIVTLVLDGISLLILAIAALNIAHTFSMTVVARRREFGLMRALGARAPAVGALVMCEAAFVGALAGAAGVALGWGVSRAADWALTTQVADFPFKPETLFAWEPWLLGAAIGGALLSCALGALPPAWRAARLDPVRALST